jgi:ComF family protein
MWERIWQLLFPDRCWQCGCWYTAWCAHCRRQVPAYSGVIPDLPVEKVIICAAYTGKVREHILRYKYVCQRHLAVVLSHLLVPHIAAQAYVVPVPTAASRIRRRGFDHMLLCATTVTRLRPARLAAYLQRTRDTPTQAKLSRRARFENVAKAFVWVGPVDATQCYVLIDDVCTTGATLAAAVDAMRQAGIQHIEVVVIAGGHTTAQA